MAQREAQREAGKKPRGKDPEPPQASPKDRDKVNLTDEASHIMPVSGGGFEQSWNAQASWSASPPDAPPPENTDPLTRTALRLGPQAGGALHTLRKQPVEPVFGIIKRVMGWRQMSMRGLEKANGEWNHGRHGSEHQVHARAAGTMSRAKAGVEPPPTRAQAGSGFAQDHHSLPANPRRSFSVAQHSRALQRSAQPGSSPTVF